jgi:hypothetical protein
MIVKSSSLYKAIKAQGFTKEDNEGIFEETLDIDLYDVFFTDNPMDILWINASFYNDKGKISKNKIIDIYGQLVNIKAKRVYKKDLEDHNLSTDYPVSQWRAYFKNQYEHILMLLEHAHENNEGLLVKLSISDLPDPT